MPRLAGSEKTTTRPVDYLFRYTWLAQRYARCLKKRGRSMIELRVVESNVFYTHSHLLIIHNPILTLPSLLYDVGKE